MIFTIHLLYYYNIYLRTSDTIAFFTMLPMKWEIFQKRYIRLRAALPNINRILIENVSHV